MKKVTLEMRIGSFVVSAVVLVLLFAIVKGQKLFHTGEYEIKAVFGYVGGIDRGSPVRVSGVRVGEVKRISLEYENAPRVYLTLSLNPEVKLGRHSQVLIRSNGLIGEKYVEIMPTPLNDLPLVKAGETIPGTEPLPLDRLLVWGEELGRSIRGFVASVDKLVGDPKLKVKIFGTLDSVQDMSVEAKTALASIDAAAGKLQDASVKAEELMVSTKEAVDQSKPALMAVLLNFQVASAGFAQASNQVTELLKKAQSDQSSLGLLISSPDVYKRLDQSLTDLETSAAQFSAASKDLEGMLSDMRAGKGSVGKFMTKDDVYNDVRGFVSEIRAKPWRLLRPGS